MLILRSKDIANNFIEKNDSALYDVHGAMIYDPSISYDVVLQDIPAVPFVDYWSGLFNLNQTFMDDIHNRSDKCGYTSFMEEALTFPPKGVLPAPPNVDYSMPGCELWNDIFSAVSLVSTLR